MRNSKFGLGWRISFIILVLALFAAACSDGEDEAATTVPAESDQPAATSGPDTAVSGEITMIKGPHSADEAVFEQMIIDDFAAVAPDVNVTFTTYDWANMVTELTTGFASGNPSDVLYLVDLIYPQFAEGGQLLEMTEFVNDPAWAEERAAIAPFAWDLATSADGKIWGVPVLGAAYNIFVNKDLLEAAGVSDTWDDSYESMLAAAEAMTTDDVYGFAQRTALANFAFWDWYPYMHNAGGDVFNADATACGLNNADTIAAMEFLVEIHSAGVTPPIDQYDGQGMQDLFRGGKIAIYHDETPFIGPLNTDPPDFEWDVAMAPPGPVSQTVMGNFGILTIAADSDNKDAAWEFIKHWASGPQVGRFAEQVNLQVVRDDIVSDLFGDNPAMASVQANLVPAVQGLQAHPKILEALQTIWPTAEDAYRGNLTGAEAIEQMCSQIDSVLSK